MGEPAEALFVAAQVEEELALRLGGSDLDDTPVAQNEFVDFGANPVHREGDQTDVHGGVEAANRLHQADITLLNEVGMGQAVAAVAAGNVGDETQMGHHQLTGRIHVSRLAIGDGKCLLILFAEYRDLVNCMGVRLDAAYREVHRYFQCLGHTGLLFRP